MAIASAAVPSHCPLVVEMVVPEGVMVEVHCSWLEVVVEEVHCSWPEVVVEVTLSAAALVQSAAGVVVHDGMLLLYH